VGRLRLVLVCLAACYAPQPPAGVPCDPSGAACPSGQVCVPRGGEHVCGPPGSGDGIDAPIDPIDAPQPDAPDPARFEYGAVVAECVNPNQPSALECRAINGDAELAVDLRDSATNAPWVAYVRFDLDAAFAGRTITRVVLRATTTDAPNAEGPQSGEVFAVEPFAAADLEGTAPAKISDRLAPSTGPVDALTTVEWPLPSALVSAGGSVYLGLFPIDENGVNYGNTSSATPPRLVIDTR
jgi:hypothetical protein